MMLLFDWAWAWGAWGAVGVFLGLSLAWGLLVWTFGYWLKRLGVHKSHVIAQAQMVLFLAGVALLLDLVFVPYVLIGPYGTAVGVLIVVLLQTILFLYRKTEKRPRGDGEGSFGSDSSLWWAQPTTGPARRAAT